MRKMYKNARVTMNEEDINLDWHKTDIIFEPGKGYVKIPTGIFLNEKSKPEEFSTRIVHAYEFKK